MNSVADHQRCVFRGSDGIYVSQSLLASHAYDRASDRARLSRNVCSLSNRCIRGLYLAATMESDDIVASNFDPIHAVGNISRPIVIAARKPLFADQLRRMEQQL